MDDCEICFQPKDGLVEIYYIYGHKCFVCDQCALKLLVLPEHKSLEILVSRREHLRNVNLYMNRLNDKSNKSNNYTKKYPFATGVIIGDVSRSSFDIDKYLEIEGEYSLFR